MHPDKVLWRPGFPVQSVQFWLSAPQLVPARGNCCRRYPYYKNIKELCRLISKDEWQKSVYSATGVIPVLSSGSIPLVSNCGFIELDSDAEYRYRKGEDLTEYCMVNSPEDLIHYISKMESYHKYLFDQPLGSYTKSELFWAVKERILRFYEDWELDRIRATKDEITLEMGLSGYDSTDIDVPLGMNLNQTLSSVVEKMNFLIDGLNDIPLCRVHDRRFSVPRRFEELIATIR